LSAELIAKRDGGPGVDGAELERELAVARDLRAKALAVYGDESGRHLLELITAEVRVIFTEEWLRRRAAPAGSAP